ncbi:MAG: universal stress protein [Flavobacteriaceae bacterium]|nr:universal stress protein [Flavobacteriaceae bacterium]
MKTILVPLGNSDKAINTLQYAVDFASIAAAKIYVIQVYGATKVAGAIKKIDAILEADSKEELNYILSQVDSKNIEIVAKSVKGQITDSISRIAKQLEVDLIIASAKNNSADSSIYLGPITGSIVKKTELPMLVIPKGYKFKPINKVLLGLRSGMLKHAHVLDPLYILKETFKTEISLLHVITPHNTTEDNVLNSEFESVSDKLINSENATVFQGVLEHKIEIKPDIICVIRRKRGFFNRLWAQNSVKKIDFESRVPLLVLKGNQ